MKNILIFQPEFGGHALEYVKHLYTGAIKNQQNKYFFCLHKDFCTKDEECEFVDTDNVIVLFIAKEITNQFKQKSHLYFSYLVNLLLKDLIYKYQISSVFLISYDYYYPLLPFFLVKGVKYSGIYYFIYLYKWKKCTLKNKLKLILLSLLMFIMSRHTSIKNIYICNDSSAAAYFNKLFSVKKFKSLVDPYNLILPNPAINFKKQYNIPENKIIIAHFGALDYRKGTMDILKAIQKLSIDIANRYTFVFAGKIGDSISSDFYEEIKKSSLFSTIIVIDDFCSNQTIASLCKVSDLILMPYKETSQSSGMFGYAAQFNIPVVAPNKNLIGKIVKRFKLGYTLENINSDDIAHFLSIYLQENKQKVDNRYININNRQKFINQIFTFL